MIWYSNLARKLLKLQWTLAMKCNPDCNHTNVRFITFSISKTTPLAAEH